jgi:hypothetical protein
MFIIVQKLGGNLYILATLNPHEIFFCSPARGLQQRFSIFWRVAKQPKVAITIVMSVRPDGTTRPPLGRFFMKLNIFRKSIEKIQVSLKSDTNNGYFPRRPMHIYGNTSLNYS